MQGNRRALMIVGVAAALLAIAMILIANPAGAVFLGVFASLTLNVISTVLEVNPFMALLWVCLAVTCLIVLALLCLVWQARKYEPGDHWT